MMKKLFAAFVLLLALCLPGAAQKINICTLNASGYFIVGDTNPGSQVWKASTGAMIANSDAGYRTWLNGNGCPIIGGNITAVANNGSGAARLTVGSTTSLTSNQYWNVANTSTYDGVQQITVIDGIHVDLIGSTFSVTATGQLYGSLIEATTAQLYADIASFNTAQWATAAQFNSISFAANGSITVAQLARFLTLTNTSGGNINVKLPQDILFGSMPPGAIVRIFNGSTPGSANSIQIQNASGGIGSGRVAPGAFVDATLTLADPTTDGPKFAVPLNVQLGSIGAPAAGNLFVGQDIYSALFQPMSGDCTFVSSGAITCTKTNGAAFASVATSGSASDLSTGTLAAARGGAGTINGALKGNGAGAVSQAACADLSNGTTNCSAAVGQLPGTTTNDSASAGNIGEYITATATTVSILTNSPTNGTSISLTAGDWDVQCTIKYNPAATTSVSTVLGAINTVSATRSGTVGTETQNNGQTTVESGFNPTVTTPMVRESLSGTTTVYCVGLTFFTVSTMTMDALIRARRIR